VQRESEKKREWEGERFAGRECSTGCQNGCVEGFGCAGAGLSVRRKSEGEKRVCGVGSCGCCVVGGSGGQRGERKRREAVAGCVSGSRKKIEGAVGAEFFASLAVRLEQREQLLSLSPADAVTLAGTGNFADAAPSSAGTSALVSPRLDPSLCSCVGFCLFYNVAGCSKCYVAGCLRQFCR
jgi:hypothetical protein